MTPLKTIAILLMLTTCVMGKRQEDLRKCVCHDSVAGAPCAGHSDGCKDYGLNVGIATAIPVGLFFILFWGLWCFGCMRGCCHWCGDSRPRSGCCMKGSNPHQGYAGREVILFQAAMALTLATAIAVGIPSITSNEKITNGVKGFGGTIEHFSNVVIRAVDVLEHESANLVDLSQASRDSIATEASNTRDNVKDITDFKSDIFKYDHEDFLSRTKVVLILIGVCFLCFTLLAFVALFKMHGCLASIINTLIMTVGFWIAIISSAHYGLSLVSNDLCDDYQTLTQNLLSKLEDKLGCDPSKPEGISEVIARTEDGMAVFVNRVCRDVVPPLCEAQGSVPALFDCVSVPCAGNGSFHEFGPMLADSKVSSGAAAYSVNSTGLGSCGVNCSISDCASRCEQGSDVREYAQSAVGNYTTYGKAFTAIEREVYPVATCLVLSSLRDQVYYPLCDDVDVPLTGLARIFLAFTCLLWVAALLITLGTKRFVDPPSKNKLSTSDF